MLAERASDVCALLKQAADNIVSVTDGGVEFRRHIGVLSQAIVQAAEILKKTFRETDIIARLGGDEFGILAVSNEPDGGKVLVERLLENLHAFNARAALAYRLSLSAGTAPLDARISSIEDALQEADLAMYEQKRSRKTAGGRSSSSSPAAEGATGVATLYKY